MKQPKIPFIMLIVACLSLVASSLHAQLYFGKNKVQYTNFNWQVMETDHFKVYFYVEEHEVAEMAAAMAEESYLALEDKFNHALSEKVPLILYSARNYFQQTNTIPYLLPESVGGFMEFIKGRVVVPFDGSLHRLDMVIRHELVHVFTFDKLSFVLRSHNKFRFRDPPLWFVEGLAEYWSAGWDSQADMVLRDAMVSGTFVPLSDIDQISGSFLMYKEGQSFLRFIAEEYGEQTLWEIFEDWWMVPSLDQAFRLVAGRGLKELGEEWEYHLKKRYFPIIEDYDLPTRMATKLTFVGDNVNPTALPVYQDSLGRGKLVFKSSRLGYSNLYLTSTEGEQEGMELLVKGERSSDLESLYFLRGRMSISRQNQLAFVSKMEERDVLHIFDLNTRKIVQTLQFGELIALSSPAWSPNSQKICLVGTAPSGFNDLYLVDIATGHLTRLTEDIYDDQEPTWWSPARIVFSSDRTEAGREGNYNLFAYELKIGRVSQLTNGSHHDLSPCADPGGNRIAFSSDRDGIYNIYLLEHGQIKRVTRVLTGAFDPAWSSDGKEILFSGYQEHGFQIYRSEIGHVSPEEMVASSDEFGRWRPSQGRVHGEPGTLRYRREFALDLAQSAIAYDFSLGTGGGAQLAVTDMLGDFQYHFLLGSSGTSREDFLSRLNLGATFLNLQHRLNYGYGLFHLFDEFYDHRQGYYAERQYGGFGAISYPLSKFRRAEASLFLRQSDREFPLGGLIRRALLASYHISYVEDTSLWGPVGPIDGIRLNVTAGLTWDPRHARIYNRMLLGDLRRYFRLARRSCYALRLIGQINWGTEPRCFSMGGSWTFRGYEHREFAGRKLVLINNELRFPLVDEVAIGFPIGRMGLRAIRGSLFFDLGNAWDNSFDGLYGSFGLGMRLRVGYYTVLRFDWSKTTDFSSISNRTTFDFFFGWNY